MIIISKHTNQLCNRIFTYLPIISYALEAREKICFIFQYEGYSQLFPNLEKSNIQIKWNDKHIKASIHSMIINGLVRFIDKFVHLVLKPGEKIPMKKPLGVLFNPKWKEIRYDNAYIDKHAETLRYLFSPANEIVETIIKTFNEAPQADITIGVHIRRGDYKEFRNGIWYYENDVYHEKMKILQDILHKKRQSVRFYISSNEKITPNDFSECNIFTQQGKELLVDLYGLAHCDYIIGPPSTFSQWASFYGKKPLRHIVSKDCEMNFDLFQVIVNLQ